MVAVEGLLVSGNRKDTSLHFFFPGLSLCSIFHSWLVISTGLEHYIISAGWSII